MNLDREPHKQAEIDSHDASLALREAHSLRKPFGTPWGNEYWVKWATVSHVLPVLGLRDGSEVLDLGCGTGWTTLFLAEAGYRPLGLSLAPSEIEVARKRAERWQSAADFVVGDMDSFDLDRQFDAVLLFDALHHSVRPGVVIDNVAQHLRSGGWLLIGEPSILHSISPDARRTHKELGWMEKGVSIRAVKHWCSQSGMGDFQRFFEGTRPYTGRGRPFLWQLVRLVAANFAVAPQTSVWLAARKLGER